MISPLLPSVLLAPGRERPLLGRHPWVFSGAVQRVEGSPEDGETVMVRASDGRFVAWGLFNGRSQIRVRLYSWDADRPPDDAFFAETLLRATDLRARLGLLQEGIAACRLVFSEGDGLSGLVVDRYGPWLVVQLTSLALARRLDPLLDQLEARFSPRGVYLRTEKGILEEEGLALRDGLLRGQEPEGPIAIEEDGVRYLVDLRVGQKTGFFLDHRLNRPRVAAFAHGRRAADVFCYTGGFTLPLLRGGARCVTGVDASGPALELARSNLRANDLPADRVEWRRADAFRWLEESAAGEPYDLIVLDPPRFARSTRGVAQALRGYARLNALAVACLTPGGILVTCSCTGRVTRDAFLGVIAEVEARSGRRIRLLESRGQAPDHPVSPTCPETEYLKCLICSVE
jgi:23S rRNA (cytosine1962-C5)-methyltransferase